MGSNDVNGGDQARDSYLKFLALCEQAYRPHAPIDLPEFFAGRGKYIQRLQVEINAPGRQVAICGERGVGKTSLAQLAYFFLDRDEDQIHFVRCEKSSTFDGIFADVLASAGFDVVLNGVESEGERKGSLAIGGFGLAGARRVRRNYRRLTAGRQITPRILLDQFGNVNGLLIIDEYDRVIDPTTHTRMAELIKHFSDAASLSKIMIVGVADTVSDLIGEHESLSRSLAQIKLERMSDDELRDIIGKGEEHLDASFKTSVKHRIIRLADGFPYFVHLICRHAAIVAARQRLKDPQARMVIAEDEYAEGLGNALENAESTLADQYQQAIITTRRRSEKFTLVLWAIALSDSRDVQVKQIAKDIGFFTGEVPAPGSFNWNLGELASDKRGHVLTKIREGYYKFTNPLMRPYVRSMMELENVVRHGQQWEFPFMKTGS